MLVLPKVGHGQVESHLVWFAVLSLMSSTAIEQYFVVINYVLFIYLFYLLIEDANFVRVYWIS